MCDVSQRSTTSCDRVDANFTFEISEELQERHGYPRFTKELKAKILGLNGARLYGVTDEQIRASLEDCTFTRRELERIRRQLPGRLGALGPRTLAQAEVFRDHDRIDMVSELG